MYSGYINCMWLVEFIYMYSSTGGINLNYYRDHNGMNSAANFVLNTNSFA